LHFRSYLDLPISKACSKSLKPDIILTFSENKWHLEFEREKKMGVTYIKMNHRCPQTRYLILRRHEGKAKCQWMRNLSISRRKSSDNISNAKLWSYCRWFLVIQTLICIGKYLNCNHMFKKQTDHRQDLNWEHYRHAALKVI